MNIYVLMLNDPQSNFPRGPRVGDNNRKLIKIPKLGSETNNIDSNNCSNRDIELIITSKERTNFQKCALLIRLSFQNSGTPPEILKKYFQSSEFEKKFNERSASECWRGKCFRLFNSLSF